MRARPGRVTVAVGVLAVAGALATAACTTPAPEQQDVAALETDLPTLVVLPEDLDVTAVGPQGYQQFDVGPTTASDHGVGPRGDEGRFGRIAGWKSRYKQSGGTKGPLVVESRVDLFPDAASAGKDLAAYRGELSQHLAADGPSEVTDVGDGSVAVVYRQPGQENVVFATVAWREESLTASVTLNGFEGQIGIDAAVTLARRVQNRIAPVVGQ